jgi:hypothetical protein
VALLFGPGTCGWRTGEDGAGAERRQAQAARAERRAAGRRRQEEAAEAEDSPWCICCRRGLCEHQGRCVQCWMHAVIGLGLGLQLVAAADRGAPWCV